MPCGQMRDEKLHAVVARSPFPSVLEVVMSKKCTPLWRRISKSKVLKTNGFGALLEVEMLEKCTPLWREAHCQVKLYKTHHIQSTFGN